MEYFASYLPSKEIQLSDEQDELEKLSVKAVQVIKKFTEKGDPVSVLNQHYQKNGIINITNNFTYSKWDQQDRKKYWKCSFSCPLSEQTVKSSILALALFHQEPPSALAELSEKIFGEHLLFEGEVYFDKKKGAKKSVAFAMLLHLFSSGIPDECNTIQKTKETKENTTPHTEKPPPSKKTLNRLRANQIKWIDDLHEAGVRKVDISYHECRSREDSGSWRGQQTKIQCHMKTEKPLNVEVESVTATSRREARCDAVAKLTQKLISCRDECANDLATKRNESSTDILIEKQKLIECDTPLCNFLFPPPHWAPDDLFLKNCGDVSRNFLLFEVSLRLAKHGRALPKNMTKIGVLLSPCKELRIKSSFEASFQLDGKEYIVTLKNRQQLKAESDSRWHLLDKLNGINWKTYGINNNPSCPARTTRNYIFVPLLFYEEMKIDWNMVENIVSGKTSPYLMVSRNFKASVVWAAVVTLALVCIPRRNLEWIQVDCSSSSLLFFAVFISRYFVFPDYKYRIADNALNYFLKHKTGKGNSLTYLISSTKNDGFNANSLLRHDRNTTGKRITFRDYFRKRYGVKIKHPRQKLVNAYKIEKMSDFLHFEEKEYVGKLSSPINVHLIPELMVLLPMPLDFLSTIRFAAHFMPPLERAVQLASVSDELEAMAETVVNVPTNNVLHYHPTMCKNESLCNLLDDATTTYPIKRYEKLEFLGDSILNYFVFLNLFENNFLIEWDHDDLGELAQEAYKNTSLVDAALQAGLNRMLCVCMVRWNDNAKGSNKEQRCLVSEKTLSDVVESLLAAIFLHRYAGDAKYANGEMAVSFLKILNLPLTRGAIWLLNQGGCLTVGYPFQTDPNWNPEMQEIAVALTSAKVAAKLEANRQALLSKLDFETTSIGEKLRKDLEEWAPKILLHVALFDSSLDGSDGLLGGNGLERAALVRDSLYHVGHSALSLILSEQLYHLHSNATTGDLHLLRSCMVSDDVIVYIMITWGIHKFLFDCLDVGVSEFEQHISVANGIGRKEWDRNGGWILPGGRNEYYRRINIAFPRHSPDYNSSGPAYPGLAGGRLQGHKKKINKSTTENLMFSFKCIVGAITLSIGADATWYILRPLFEEAMVLTADEYRKLFPDSICSNYSQGKTNTALNNTRK